MFKNIIGYENYMINEYGDVINSSGKPISYYINNKGYKIVDLSKNGETKHFLVHRLVAIHFVENPDNKPIVLHKDNNKLNTYYENLIWGTYSENNSQAISDGLNILPIPDNNKYYEVYKGNDIIVCRGANEVKALLNCSESVVRNLLFRQTEIKSGKYSGYKVRKATKMVYKPIYCYK